MKKKIVISASILDLCHKGHLNLLREMRKNGDKTIMVLHDDYSCFLIKDKFPIWDLKRRKNALKMTGLIDEIYTAKKQNPGNQFEKIIKKYKGNDLLFMRGDDNKNFPGKEVIDEHNIPIEYVPYTKGVSSTQLKDLILQL